MTTVHRGIMRGDDRDDDGSGRGSGGPAPRTPVVNHRARPSSCRLAAAAVCRGQGGGGSRAFHSRPVDNAARLRRWPPRIDFYGFFFHLLFSHLSRPFRIIAFIVVLPGGAVRKSVAGRARSHDARPPPSRRIPRLRARAIFTGRRGVNRVTQFDDGGGCDRAVTGGIATGLLRIARRPCRRIVLSVDDVRVWCEYTCPSKRYPRPVRW